MLCLRDWMATAGARASLPLLGLVLGGCTGPARPQLLVLLDTDLPVTAQALNDSHISQDAAVDTLRIDVIAPDGTTKQELTAAAPDFRDWPVSFGVEGLAEESVVRIRARLFRSSWSTTADLHGVSVLEPFRELAVSRVLEVPVPNNEVRTVRAVLRGDCRGIAPTFATPYRTCISGDRTDELATEGIDILQGPAPDSEVGTWPLAFEHYCNGDSPVTGAVCIAGGFSVLGEPGLTNVSDGVLYQHDPTPARPVLHSPFFMDSREYTVQRFRDQMKQSPSLLQPGEMPLKPDPASEYLKYCTYLGPDDATNDGLPLDCITFAASRTLCQAAGGDLPSEAQWEHAARGRGRRNRYAWGNTEPTCCDASLAILNHTCPGTGPQAALGGPGCGTHIDQTLDLLLDMTGNLYERTLDSSEPYTAACWAKPGILQDPLCKSDAVAHVNRGGAWTTGLEHGMLALRSSGLDKASQRDVGFRCIYPDGGKP